MKQCSPDFVTGVTKLQQGKFQDLSSNQLTAIECLRLRQASTPSAAAVFEANLNLVERGLAESKRARRDDSYEQFGNTNFVLPSANIVERVFSRLNLIFDDRRMTMTVDTLEMMIMLRANRHLWNVEWLLEGALDDDTLSLSEEDDDYLEEDFFVASDDEDDEDDEVPDLEVVDSDSEIDV